MSAERGCFGLRNGSQSHDCQQTQSSGKSASELLQGYIDRFERTVDSADEGHRAAGRQQQRMPSGAGAGAASAAGSKGRLSWETPPVLVQLPPELPSMDDDRDTQELLCGGQATCGGVSGTHVSVRTRRILRDAERQLSSWQPSYSVPDKLDLRTVWPSMHEHMERRWRQQLRARYEARQRQEAEAAAAAAAVQGSRADLYSSSNRQDYKRRWAGSSRTVRQQSLQAAPQTLVPPTKPDDSDEASDTSGTEKAAAADSADSDNDDAPGTFGGSLAEAAAISAESEDDDDEERDDDLGGGRPWGSDSGLGLSSRDRRHQPPDEFALDKEGRDQRKTTTAGGAGPDVNLDDDDEFADHCSFEERMRSYRFVLEAHELSAQLRQRLEVACAAVGGPRALTAEQKGRIRDRLTRLQHPGLPAEQSEPFPQRQPQPQQPSTCTTQPPPEPPLQAPQPTVEKRVELPQQQRISTERLTRLMSSARGLLAENNCRLTSCSRLCDSLTAAAAAAATAAAAVSVEQHQKQLLQQNTRSTS